MCKLVQQATTITSPGSSTGAAPAVAVAGGVVGAWAAEDDKEEARGVAKAGSTPVVAWDTVEGCVPGATAASAAAAVARARLPG